MSNRPVNNEHVEKTRLLADFFVVAKCVNNHSKNKLANLMQPVLVIL